MKTSSYVNEPDLDELLAKYPQLQFTYPLFFKLFFGVSGLAMFILPILSMSARNLYEEPLVQIISAALISLFGLLCLYYGNRLIGKITITNTHITLSRFGQKKKLEFSKIEQIHNRKIDRSLILEGCKTSIRIEKQLTYYGLVYDIIKQKTGDLTPEQKNVINMEFPIIVTSNKSQYWWIVMVFLAGICMSVVMVGSYIRCTTCGYEKPQDVWSLFMFPLLALGWLGLMAIIFVYIVQRIELQPNTIIIGNLYGQIELPASSLISVVAHRKFRADDDPCYDLEIKFRLEEIDQLQKNWTLPTKQFWRNLSNLSETKEHNVILISDNQFNANLKDIYDFMTRNYLSNTV